MFQYVDGEITRNFILAGCAIFVVTLLLIVDIVTSFFVLICVVLTTVSRLFITLYYSLLHKKLVHSRLKSCQNNEILFLKV